MVLIVELVLLIEMFKDPNAELPLGPGTPEIEPLPKLAGYSIAVQEGLLLIERVIVVTY